LHHRTEAQLFAQFLGNAIGFSDVLRKIPAVLLGDRLSRAANIGHSSLVEAGCVWECVHGDSP
jgi:hypothetical protein